MQVSVETTSGLERRMTVTVPKENIDNEVQKRLKDLAKRVKIDGFRPGKVPFSVVRQKFSGQVSQEVMGEVMQNSFYEAVTQEKLRPAGMPLIEPGDSKEGFEFTATFEVYPEFEVKGLEKIKVERPVLEISDEDIDKMLETIRKQRKTWQAVDRPAQEGDQLTIDFVGTLDGEEFQGGTAQQVKIELGSKRMIPGFEEQLIGAKPSDELTLDVTFPEDYHAKDLAGKAVQFATTVHTVEEPVLPELNDEFATEFGIKEGGLEALKQQVRENMQREAEQTIAMRVKEQVFDGLMGLDLLEVPKALVDGEIENLVKQRQQDMQQYGVPAQDVDPAQFETQARRRVSLGLILSEVIKANDITVPPARLREAVEKLASSYEYPEEVVKYYYADKDRLKEVENVTLEEMAVEHVLSQAKVSDKKTSFDALMNPGQTAS
ncbi:MAG TPA: trigger factor [Gammaproteobacteria bacterium]|nr:trigger factor [Gammaproteobacteria bacterium]